MPLLLRGRWFGPCIFLGIAVFVSNLVPTRAADETPKFPVTFTGGHDTDRKLDGGRPVVLIAAALGVKTETFREAFSGVTPSKNGKPSGEEARRNKEALMKVLKPLGITNDRLDEVSNYYRYRPQAGELWTNRPAKAHAVVENGKLVKIVVDDAGAGYSSQPNASIAGFESATLNVEVRFGKDLKTNGSIGKIDIVKAEK